LGDGKNSGGKVMSGREGTPGGRNEEQDKMVYVASCGRKGAKGRSVNGGTREGKIQGGTVKGNNAV